MPTSKNNKNNPDIKIKRRNASLAEFVKRPLPTDKEVEAFDEYVEDELKQEEIKESLEEIYQDDKGNMVNVKTMDIKKSRGFIFKFFTFILMMGLLAGAGVAVFNYVKTKLPAAQTQVSIAIDAAKEIMAGKEFYYLVDYKNEENVTINNIEIKLTYPDNFIFASSEPAASQGDHIWQVSSLGPHRSDLIKIKGRLIGEAGSAGTVSADMTYTPANFSSEFKKSASRETTINDIGLEINAVSASSAIVGEANEIVASYKAREENYLNNFTLAIEASDNLKFTVAGSVGTSTALTKASSTGQIILPGSLPNTWLVKAGEKGEHELRVKFYVKEKKASAEEVVLKFQAMNDLTGKAYIFYNKIISLEVIKSDLNLNLIINGSAADQGVNTDQVLNYSLNYANKGETDMKDVIIMAVLESDFLDWSSLEDNGNGQAGAGTVSWSKQEIPALAQLAKNDQGTIDFSLKLKPIKQYDPAKLYQIKSYAQYNIEGREAKAGESNQSNVITNKINSDLSLTQKVRYFDDDNIAVGFGPVPPKVGQTTSFKVYLNLTNNMHELNDLAVTLNLPSYVKWEDKNRSSAGSLEYDAAAGKIRWKIGRLPVSVYRADAEFNISITPAETDRNRIVVLLPDTAVSAIDSETKAVITKTLPAKTTKLDDDAVANTDGIVE